MSYETKDYTGRLFKNDKKEKDTHPDYTGTALIGGVEHFMDAWLKTSDKGTKWMSFSFKPKQKQAEPPAPPARKAPSRPAPDMDDDVPF
jgi:hypothetical protein